MLSPLPSADSTVVTATGTSSLLRSSRFSFSSESLSGGISRWISDISIVLPANAASDPSPPTNEEVKLLQDAFAALYGVPRDLDRAQSLLSQVIKLWGTQPSDERAALYRVRGDCYLKMQRPSYAIPDFTQALELLNDKSPAASKADQSEISAAYLGRARAYQSTQMRSTLSPSEYDAVAEDYATYLKLSAREEDFPETERELLKSGAESNPYAAWEWGIALRQAGQMEAAEDAHGIAAAAFRNIGDRPREIISDIDRAIDLAVMASSGGSVSKAVDSLRVAIASTAKVESNDVDLLARLVAREGEGRVALASILWGESSTRSEAEKELGIACQRLEVLQIDSDARDKARLKRMVVPKPADTLGYGIDDTIGPGEISCSRFKNEKFLQETLGWPVELRQKANKLNKLQK
eukprot:CAMPEP_0113309556 /NCGR_PEP_ID=MMETSP0010_2-20120614/7550_1 /TAXON_ID=216773 ORGANISM="Corethron hystrix, Strain 308" /NCGR_SAMPLE_ID=MMETSP0010_2 /ASSEMBLY_ACC=CAM_ASM_000155 /LENGTH=408 /DNA_ID=CAMNT_0000164827 /DNA_START=104 /DNA_END=1330 /DNA_ORIENTATION=+ /assembly_acc=CAM_ASM_000155